MFRHQENRRARHWLLLAGGGALAACSHQTPPAQPAITAAEVQAQAPTFFTFAPPPGTHFVRTETRSTESSLAGTSLRRTTEDELQWLVDVNRSSDGYTIHQDLAHVTFRTNDKTVADADVTRGTIALDLITDQKGNLSDIRGIDQASRTLAGIAGPDAQDAVADEFSPAALRAMVSARYQAVQGNLVGRPANVGASWTLPGDADQMILSRKVTVEGTQLCGAGMCDRIRMDVDVDTAAVTRAANALAKEFVAAQGGDASQVKVTQASDAIQGVLVAEPSTLLSHRATLDEKASVMVVGSKRTFDFRMRQSTRLDYDYEGATPQAMTSRWPER